MFSPLAWSKMNMIIDIADKEVGWLGTVDHDTPSNTYYIDDVYIVEQTVSGAETDMSPENIANFFDSHIDIANRVNFWGHSHVDMATNPSHQDKKQVDSLMEDLDYLVIVIGNKQQDLYTAVITKEFYYENVKHSIYLEEDSLLRAELELDILQKVNERAIIMPKVSKLMASNPYGYHNYYEEDYGNAFDSFSDKTTSFVELERERVEKGLNKVKTKTKKKQSTKNKKTKTRLIK